MLELHEIYMRAVAAGKKADPRGPEGVERFLRHTKRRLERMSSDAREEAGKEILHNPYTDTRVLHGDRKLKVRRIMVGIDIGPSEILAAQLLRMQGRPVDLVVAHHPYGKAIARFSQIIPMQADIMAQLGVPINVAEGMMAGEERRIARGLLPKNVNREVDLARLFDIPYMCIHTPADNWANQIVQDLIDEAGVEYVGEIVPLLKEMPEYKAAVRYYGGPQIVVGSPDRRTGKVLVDMTGGTATAPEAYERMAAKGVGTVVAMYLSQRHYEMAEKNFINVIAAGHSSSDSLGMNLIFDEIFRDQDDVEFLECSGFTRVDRRGVTGDARARSSLVGKGDKGKKAVRKPAKKAAGKSTKKSGKR